MALVTRVSTIWVTIVDTGQRILKSRFVVPGCTDGSSVSSLLNEVQFIFEKFENIALIRCHGDPTSFSSVLITNPEARKRKEYAIGISYNLVKTIGEL